MHLHSPEGLRHEDAVCVWWQHSHKNNIAALASQCCQSSHPFECSRCAESRLKSCSELEACKISSVCIVVYCVNNQQGRINRRVNWKMTAV